MASNTDIQQFFVPIINQIDGASYVCLNINESSLSTPNVIQPYVTVNNRGGQPAMFVKIFGLKEFVIENAPSTYTLPIASASVLGGIKVGSGLSIAGDGTLSASGGGGTVTSVSGTANRITSTGGTTPIIDIDSAYDALWQPKTANLTSISGLTYASTSFVKMTSAGTFALDTNTYITNAIISLNGLIASTQTFTNDTNVTIISSGSAHVITWSGTLADSRIASASTWNAKIGGSGTTNEIAYFTASGTIASLTVVTYPSLTELSYVKGVSSQVVGISDTNTLTNKRITKRVLAIASSATPVINTNLYDQVDITGNTSITSMSINLSGSPSIDDLLIISFKTASGTATIAWGSSFSTSIIGLPTSFGTTQTRCGFQWNGTTWVIIAYA